MEVRTTIEGFWDVLDRHKGTAVFEGDLRLSYAELSLRMEHFIRQYLSGNKGLVVLRAANCLNCLVAYLACLRARWPLMLLDEKVTPNFLHNTTARFKPRLIIDCSGDETVCSYEANTSTELWDPQLALLLATSGSSGDAKWVMLSYSNLQANATSITAYLNILPSDLAITSLPFAYSYGLSVINSHMLAGAGVLMTRATMLESAFWESLASFSVTSLAGVPFQYQVMERIGFRKRHFPDLHTLTQAGGRLEDSLVELYTQDALIKNRRFFVMYGQTEATARIAYCPMHEAPHKLGTIGIAIPGGELELENEDGQPVTQTGIVAELIYNGPNVMMGYAKDAHDLIVNGKLSDRLHTGDLALRDDDGYYYLKGRISRIVKVVGKRWDLDSLEKSLLDYGFITKVAGRDDSIVFAVETGHLEVLKKVLHTQFRLPLGYFSVLSVPEFPRTTNGKIDYQAILALDNDTLD